MFDRSLRNWLGEQKARAQTETQHKRNLIMLFIMLFKLLFVAYEHFESAFCSLCLASLLKMFLLCKSGAIFPSISEKRLLSVALLSTHNEH